MGEAGAFPNVAKTFSRWFPVTERGTAQGIFFAGAHLGGGLTPLLVTALLDVMPWRMVFVVFGLIGFVWALAWFRWFRDDPAEHPARQRRGAAADHARRPVPEQPHRLDAGVARADPDRPEHVCPLPDVLHAGLRLLLQLHLAADLPGEARGFTVDRMLGGLLAGLPLILSAVADLVGGLTHRPG